MKEIVPSWRIVGFVKYSTRKYIGVGLGGTNLWECGYKIILGMRPYKYIP